MVDVMHMLRQTVLTLRDSSSVSMHGLGTWQPTFKVHGQLRALSVERDTMTDQNSKTVLWLCQFSFFFSHRTK